MNFDQLNRRFPSRIERPATISDIPSGVYFVYILTIDESPVIVGHGKKNRARVIFDSKKEITPNHIKAMMVRLYTLFGQDDAAFNRYLIRCVSKQEAKDLESGIHREFGGNTLSVPSAIRERLFDGLQEDSLARMALRMALCSSFDGITDLKRWRREGILADEVWRQIAERLMLPSD